MIKSIIIVIVTFFLSVNTQGDTCKIKIFTQGVHHYLGTPMEGSLIKGGQKPDFSKIEKEVNEFIENKTILDMEQSIAISDMWAGAKYDIIITITILYEEKI